MHFILGLKDIFLIYVLGLCAQYTKRRDFFVDLLIQKFDIEIKKSSDKSSGVDVYQASLRNSRLKRPIFSFVPPTAGMFIWVSTKRCSVSKFNALQLKFSFDNHPTIREVGSKHLEEKFWIALAEAGLLLVPGNFT